MTSACDDTEAELWMLINSYKNLRQRNPDHELLKLVELHEDERGMNFSEEYRKRFVQEEDKMLIQGYMRYQEAIKMALFTPNS